MSWYIHPSKELRDDELPPELVVTNRDCSIVQAYVPCNAIDQLNDENARLREERDKWKRDYEWLRARMDEVAESHHRMQERCGRLQELVADVHESLKADKAGMFHNLTLSAMEDDMRELGIEVDG